MKRSTDRILTTHGGSLVRPPEVIDGMRRLETGQPFDRDGLDADIRRSVEEVVARQKNVGIDIPSDGEQGKTSFNRYALGRLSGVEQIELAPGERPQGVGKDRRDFADFYAQYDPLSRSMWMPPSTKQEAPTTLGLITSRTGWICSGEVKYTGHETLKQELARFRAALDAQAIDEAFVPSGSPTVFEYSAKNRYYPTREAYIYALAEAMREEYRIVVDAGFILQVDAPEMPDEYDRIIGAGASEAEYMKYAEFSVETTNIALQGIPEDRVRYHICWGSWNGPHTNDVPLSKIIDLVFKVNAQAYYIEAANVRHEHEWQLWQDTKLPEGKVLMPGVVAHTTNVIEHPELVSQRIQRYAGLLGKENLIAASDCGFSQGWNSPRVHSQIQWAKLQALSDGAALASKALFA